MSSSLPRPVAAALLAVIAGGFAVVPWGTLLRADGFMPHGHCYLWRPALVAMHAGSDVVIALSYVAISVTMAVLVVRARHEIPFSWMLMAFGTFIIACGIGHLFEAWTLWVPQYWLSGSVKVLTAIVSLTTAVLLPPLVPKALRLVEAARRSEAAEEERARAERALRRANDDLERRVQERTADLRAAHEAVQRHTQRIRSLYEVAADAAGSADDRIVAALRLGCRWFGTEVGLVMRHDGPDGVVEQVYTPSGALTRGQRLALADTYAALTIEAGGPVAFADVAASPYRDHPARRAMRMPAYLGVPLVVGGRPFGTLGFAATRPLPATFDAADQDVLGLLGRWIGAVLDRRHTALELERTRDAALESARLKSEFVSTMSHELRTPLNVIIGYADMLGDPGFGPLAEPQRDLVNRVRARSRELHELITATLDLGRLEAGRDVVSLEPADLASLCCDLQAEVEDLVAPGVALRWHHDSALRPFHTDAAKLKTILKNLIGNALKFTEQGSVDVRTRFDADMLTVAVCDTGIGIGPSELPVIFDMFRQADASPTRRHGGVGLGLHIVQRLTGLLGGRIAVESQPGVGSTFTLVVPAPPAADARAA